MKSVFSRYQLFVVALLAFLQFTIVLDFMILSPLGARLLADLGLTTARFGLVVSAYAFSAGASGLLAAGFADRFDRKRLLLCFYAGFVIGTVLCGVATTYEFLLIARVTTGFFGGVIGAICFTIIADLFPLETRGRVMGIVMTAFASSQVLGIPLGLLLSNLWGWRAPFLMIAGMSALVGLLVVRGLRPIRAHLDLPEPVGGQTTRRLLTTLRQPRYLYAFATTALLSTGGFMLMPFASAFSVNNLGITLKQLPAVYMVTGLTAMIAGPLLGRLADAYGKFRVFSIGSIFAVILIEYYTHLGTTPLAIVIGLNAVMFVAVSARIISANALTSAVPGASDRGAFMAITSSTQQLSGGVASLAAGLIVVQTPQGTLDHYDVLGYVVGTVMIVTIFLMRRINRDITEQGATT